MKKLLLACGLMAFLMVSCCNCPKEPGKGCPDGPRKEQCDKHEGDCKKHEGDCEKK